MTLNEIKRDVKLVDWLGRRTGQEAGGDGMLLCPFHQEKKRSFHVFLGRDGIWHWQDFHDNAKGTIIDLVAKLDGLDEKAACKKLLDEFGGPQLAAKVPSQEKIEREHIYRDREGVGVFKKVKYGPDSWGIFHAEKNGWVSGKGGHEFIPYNLDKFDVRTEVVIAEGEKDADLISSLGVVATSAPVGKGSWPDEITPYFKQFKRISFIYDVGNDEDVRKHAAKLHTAFPETEITIANLHSTVREFDISDYLSAFKPTDKRNALDLIIQESTVLYVKPPPLTLMLSDVEPRTVPWLWQNFIPLGRATLLSGDPGSAKTWFALDLAARLSRRLPWPDGSLGSGPAQTYYMTVEDDAHDTIRPRILSLGGDAAMIAIFNSEHPLHLNLSTPEGIQRLGSEIVKLGNVRLVVVDPMVDFSGNINPNASEEVRALLTPLINLAAKMNFALLIIGHLNKAQAMSAIYRAGGSTSGWLGKCRAAFMLFRDKDDKTLRHFIPIKANLAPIDPCQIEFKIITGRIEAKVSAEEVDPDEQLNPQPERRPREKEVAQKFLEGLFSTRTEIPATEIKEAARERSIASRTLDRAKEAGNYSSKKRKTPTGEEEWVWVKP